MSHILGIDLGTTNSCVAILNERKSPEVLSASNGTRTTPSVVAFSTGNNDVLVGNTALRQMVTNPTRTIFGSKRLIGRKVNHSEVKSLAKVAPYEIAAAPNGDAWIRLKEGIISPQEIASHVLLHCKSMAEDVIGEPLTRAIITVPAYFDDSQRQATKDAGTIAGIEVLRILNEPTSAALAYGAHRVKDERRVIAVFDLGGGTFDISIMSVDDGVFEVLSTAGDTALGGDDWDRALVEKIVDEIFDKERIDVSEDPVAMGRIYEAAKKAKQDLSSMSATEINLPYLAQVAGAPLQFSRKITSTELQAITSHLVERLAAPCLQAIEDAGLDKSKLEDILLVGGMTRMPAIQEKVKAIFGKDPNKGVNPDEIVAMGAAAYAGILSGDLDDATLLDVAPHTIGIKVGSHGFAPIIDRNSMLPVRETKLFATSHDGQSFIDIDIYQGEDKDTRNNRRLGKIRLDDIAAKGAGKIKIELVMTLDVESILHVKAKELSSGNVSEIKIKPNSGLSAEDIDDIIRRRREKNS